MPQRKQKTSPSKPTLPPQLAAVTWHAAGIDVGAAAHFVAVPPRDDPPPVRRFGAYTADRDSRADGLLLGGITTVALASTGVYGLPLLERLEARGCEGVRVEPPPVQKSQGRPTSDGHDGQWSQRRHTCGRLARACRPPAQVCVLRSSLRQRAMLLISAAQHIQPMPKALTQMHIQLQHVVSDITGGTGRAILRALLAGERAPATRAQLRDDRCQHDEATMARAWQGTGREAPLCAVAQAVALYEVYHQQLTEGDRQIETSLQTFAARSDGQPWPPPARRRQRGRNQPAFAVRDPLHRIPGVDLPQIEGLDATTALVILSEIGLAMPRWPTVQHCTSWLGLCPHHRVSGGKVRRRRTQPCAQRAATAFRLAAAALPHRQRALGAFFRRMKARLGAPKAITATAHKLARLVYTRRKHGTAYVPQGLDEDEQPDRDRTVQNVTRRAQTFGSTLVKTAEVPAQGALA